MDGDGGAVRVPALDLELGADQGRALPHDGQALGVGPGGLQPPAVVAHGDHRARRTDVAVDVDGAGAGVAHGVGHRLLRDPEELGLDLGPQPARLLVDRDVDRDAGRTR